MSPDAADLADRLDLSVSSIDMTNTALAMHEEKDCDISGIGKEKTFILVSYRFLHRVKGLKMFVFPVVQRSWRTVHYLHCQLTAKLTNQS